MVLLTIFLGSDVLALIETARENNYTYETFIEKMKAYQKYNAGKDFDDLIRKIYVKYVYKGNEELEELDIFYDNIFNLIDNANSFEELDEIEAIIENLNVEMKINESEYNYLINKLNEKRNNL